MFYGDSAYDTNDMFDALWDRGSAIKICSNASMDFYHGSTLKERNKGEIREYDRIEYG